MDRQEAIKQARQKFGKQSRSKRYEQKIILALYWTNAFHFSTPGIVDCLVQNRKRGFTKRLVEKGLLVERDIFSYFPYMPKKTLVLSKAGREFLALQVPEYPIWTGKINENKIFHDYLVQIYTLHILKTKNYSSFRILREQQLYKKQYDCILTLNNELTIGIELDLNRKKTREIHNALYNIYQDIRIKKVVDEIHFVFPTQHYQLFKNEYENLLDKKVFLYEKNRFNQYEKTHNYIQFYENWWEIEEYREIEFHAIDIPPQICPPKEPEPDVEI